MMTITTRVQRRFLAASSAVALMLATGASGQETEAAYDTVIRGGTIVDGSGLAPYKGDVAIKDGHIVAVGKLPPARAAATVDATGLVVAPGLINIHSHAQPDAVATAVNMLTQGVTTEITNADGQGTVDIARQLKGFAAKGMAENVGLYIGFNAAWEDVIGTEDRRATPGEIAKMQGILETNLANGAWGVAAGLDYKPAYFADADEVVAVLSAVKHWRTNFPNHDRIRPEENYSSFKGMTETVAIAEQAGLMPVITHMKTQGIEQGNARKVIAMMDAATRRGAYTAADVYPYLAGHSGLSLMIPGWAHEGGREGMLKRFADPATRAKIVAEAEKAMTLRFGGPSGVRVLQSGLELTDAMKQMGVGAGEALVRLIEKQDSSAILSFGREDDLVAFLQYRNSAMACDCGATLGTRVHPRTWGSFPRVLGHYVRDTKALTLTDAVRKMTALPAAIIGMTDRGYLAPGMAADIAIFDPTTIRDHATYQDPTLPSEGVRHVFVNGRHALSDGKPTGAQGGGVVLRTRHMPSRPMTLASTRRAFTATATVSGASSRFAVRLKLAQASGSRYATGFLELTDASSGVRWTADRLGTIQTGQGWSSVTAVIRDPQGQQQFATLTLDRGEGATGPELIVSFDGQPELSGLVGR
jgi:N-acyl-D-amino-acid deacylase